jgi:hypothetical protein
MMPVPTLINSIGLVCDIAGVMMLFYFGPPVLNITRDGYKILPFNPNDEDETRKNKSIADRHDRLSRASLGLLLVGFALQLVSNFLK